MRPAEAPFQLAATRKVRPCLPAFYRKQVPTVEEPVRIQPAFYFLHSFDFRRRVLQRQQVSFAFSQTVLGRHGSTEFNRLTSEFAMTERSLIFVLGHSIAVGVQAMLRMNIDRTAAAAKRDGVPFYLSYPALSSAEQGKGAFDTEFMKGLFEQGVARGKGGEPFVQDVEQALRSTD